MKKYAKIINKKTKMCNVGTGDPSATFDVQDEKVITVGDYYKSIGMEEMDVEQSYNGEWYVEGYAPQQPATKEEIREQRQERYEAEADPIRYDYEEALARGEDIAEELKQEWLAKKDEIRSDLPYPVEE